MHTAELDQHWIIEVKNLSVSFGEKQVLNNINFKVIQGETLGIVGESGSGPRKSGQSCLPSDNRTNLSLTCRGSPLLLRWRLCACRHTV